VAKKYLPSPELDELYRKKDPRPLVFCHFARGLADRAYDEASGGYAALHRALTEALLEYNASNATWDLVLFEDAMKHVARISRVLSAPSGHALLVGVGGSGKQSLARLAAHVVGASVATLAISGGYSLASFRDDLGRLVRRAGVKGEAIAFLLPDSQVREGVLLCGGGVAERVCEGRLVLCVFLVFGVCVSVCFACAPEGRAVCVHGVCNAPARTDFFCFAAVFGRWPTLALLQDFERRASLATWSSGSVGKQPRGRLNAEGAEKRRRRR
jgi:hypothetical protein